MTDRDRVFAACAETVRHADPDRYFSALFAPAGKRPLLFALYAFNVELSRVAENAREPMLGEIRLQWWRETIAAARSGAPRNHDVARALAIVFEAGDLPESSFEALIDARAFDSSAERFADFAALDTYLDATSGNLMRLAARILGARDGFDAAARDAGIAYGLAGLLRAQPFHARRRKLYLPLDLLRAVDLSPEDVFVHPDRDKLRAVIRQVALNARDRYLAARRATIPKVALAAALPAALVPLYLRRAIRGNAKDIPIHRKQISLLTAAMRGRV